MINKLVTNLIENTSANIDLLNPASIDDIRAEKKPLVVLTDEVLAQHLDLKRFLHENLYRHDRVGRMTDEAREMIRTLFERYMADNMAMRVEFSELAGNARDEAERARVVADFIAGMTDRFAIAEHERLAP